MSRYGGRDDRGHGGRDSYREDRGPRQDMRSVREERNRDRVSLLVRNLPLDISPEEVRRKFERYGEVRDIYMPKDYYTQRARGFGFVEYKDPRDADDAMYSLDRTMVGNREITVCLSKESRKTPREMLQREGDDKGGRSYRGDDRRRRSRSRSPRRRSPVRRGRSDSRSPVRRRDDSRSASPARRGRSGSPVRRDRSGSPVRRDRSASPVRRGRSGSPVERGAGRDYESPERGRSASPARQDGDDGLRDNGASPMGSPKNGDDAGARSQQQTPAQST